jgi:hypothetical protein
MIECKYCNIFFFTQEGLKEHNKICIGYNPIKVSFSEQSKPSAHTHTLTHTHTHSYSHTRAHRRGREQEREI